MKCTGCGEATTKSVGDHVYRESGMSHVVLRDTTTYECQKCGAKSISIVAIAQLHRLLAETIAKKPARFISSEVRFIRDHLGLSNKDFAVLMGVTDSQTSRWTNSTNAEPVGVTAERFLRILATLGPTVLASRDVASAIATLPASGIMETLVHLPSKDEPVRNVPIWARRSSLEWHIEPPSLIEPPAREP